MAFGVVELFYVSTYFLHHVLRVLRLASDLGDFCKQLHNLTLGIFQVIAVEARVS